MLWKSTLGMMLVCSIGVLSMSDTALADEQKATFAGGCFWCIEHPYDKHAGVLAAVSGYTGGLQPNPTYEQVSAGGTGHVEAVQVSFDTQKTSYTELLDIFWQQVDPTDRGGQFADRGSQYRPVIFYHNEEQKRLAEASRDELAASGRFNKAIIVDIVPASVFYAAEDEHQDYADKNPLRYRFYRHNSGRDQFLERVWGHR